MTIKKKNSPIRNNTEKKPKKIELLPVQVMPPENLAYLTQLLPDIEQAESYFADDFCPGMENYEIWLQHKLDLIRSTSPWFFVGLHDEEPFGLIWAENWEQFHDRYFSCEVSAFARRHSNPAWSKAALLEIIRMLFEQTTVEIIRFVVEEDNRASLLSLRRAGIQHFEPRRCIKLKAGKKVTGTIGSITKEEFEALKNG